MNNGMKNVTQRFVTAIGRKLSASGRTVATAESLTGGGIGETLTSIPGASTWYRGGLITYATDTKVMLAGVSAGIIESAGVVSSEVAVALAEGARDRLRADFGIGVTGYAGPATGDEDCPVGTVWVAVAGPDGTTRSHTGVFDGTRGEARAHAQLSALVLMAAALGIQVKEAGE